MFDPIEYDLHQHLLQIDNEQAEAEWIENNNEKSKKETMCKPDYIEYLERMKKTFNKRARHYEKRRQKGFTN